MVTVWCQPYCFNITHTVCCFSVGWCVGFLTTYMKQESDLIVYLNKLHASSVSVAHHRYAFLSVEAIQKWKSGDQSRSDWTENVDLSVRCETKKKAVFKDLLGHRDLNESDANETDINIWVTK